MGSASEKKSSGPKQTHNLQAPIPKKKQKGKKVVAGKSLGVTTTTNGQGNKKTSFLKDDYNIPRKPDRFAIPEESRNVSDGRKKATKNNHQPKKNNGQNQNTKQRTDRRLFEVLATLPDDVDANEVRAALNSKSDLPEKFKDALGDTTLELNQFRDFVVPKGSKCNYRYLRRVLKKCRKLGFLEWLQGWKGWIIETDKSDYLRYCRELHKVYDIKVRALMKEVDKDTKNKLRLLYYKEPLTLKNGRNGTQQTSNQQTLWKKVNESQSLDAGVGMIRPFLEVVRYFCTDPRTKWTSLPWLMPTLSLEESRTRISRISQFVFELMRNSDNGPDTPVHWAAHPARNGYPLTVVTSESMTELIVGVSNILSHLFLCNPSIVSNLDQVDRMLSSPLWLGTEVGNSPKMSTKKGSPKGFKNKKPASSKNFKKTGTKHSNRNPRVPASDSVDDIVVGFSGFSIGG